MLKISVIIPVLNEAANLGKTLAKAQHNRDVEIIVVDGGSEDDTVKIAKKHGVKVMISPQPGRSFQMNFGAQKATGNILLFLHGDTILPEGYGQKIIAAFTKPKTIAGAFELAIDGEKLSLRLVEKAVNWRSRLLSLPYGDQGIFVKASVFWELGGFPNLPIMEDFIFIRQLKSLGKITIIPNPVITSGRRWQKLGVWKTTLLNQGIVMGYWLGVSPERLARWYHRQ